MEVLSWSHGFAQQTSPLPSRDDRIEHAVHTPLTFTKYVDAASNALLKQCWNGRLFGKATLTCYRTDAGGGAQLVEYLAVIMEHVVIANYSVSAGPNDIPVENVALDYGIVTYQYTKPKMGDLPPSTSAVTHNRQKRIIE